MKKLNLLLSAVFVVGLSSTVSAGSVTTSNGASCNDNYNFNDTSRESVQFGIETNTSTGDTELSLRYEIKLGGKKPLYNGQINRLDCSRMLHIEEHKQELELQRMQLEIKLLREKLAATQNQTQSIQSSDDW